LEKSFRRAQDVRGTGKGFTKKQRQKEIYAKCPHYDELLPIMLDKHTSRAVAIMDSAFEYDEDYQAGTAVEEAVVTNDVFVEGAQRRQGTNELIEQCINPPTEQRTNPRIEEGTIARIDEGANAQTEEGTNAQSEHSTIQRTEGSNEQHTERINFIVPVQVTPARVPGLNEARRKAAESSKPGTFTQFEKDMLQLQQEQQKSQTDYQKEMVQLQREQIEVAKKKSMFEEEIQKVQLAKLQAEAEAAALDTRGKLFENRERMLDRGHTLEEINLAFPLPREYLPPQP
jgi:hypothetical protein